MDALPILIQTTELVGSPANDQPWRTVSTSGSETLLWYQTIKQPHSVGVSSVHGQKIVFLVMDLPEFAGLERLRTFKGWQDNWDAEGGKAPNPDVIDTASKVYSLLSVHRVPQVTLCADGLPMFAYSGPVQGEVVVTSVDTLDYFFAADGAPSDEDVAFAGSHLPQALVQYISSPAQ